MSQLDPTALELPVATPPVARGRGRLRLPGWLTLLLGNPKARIGLFMVGTVAVVALIAPLISVSDPNGFSLLDAGQAPSWNHLFGTTDQGSDIFSQVVVGARRSLLLGAAAATLATALAAILGITSAYCGGMVDEVINLFINVFLTIPAIPLLVVISAYIGTQGIGTMIFVLALVLWAFEARILRGQALSLRSRDFVDAAKVSGEPTWRIVFGELMPNMISRIAAAWVLVFYVALLVDAGLEFLGLGDHASDELGRDALLGADELDRAPGSVVAVLLPRGRTGLHGPRARPRARGHRRGKQPPAPCGTRGEGGVVAASPPLAAAGNGG